MTSESPHGCKQPLPHQTLEKNRKRAKLYYLNYREKVLVKMKTSYAKKRQRQVEEHCETSSSIISKLILLYRCQLKTRHQSKKPWTRFLCKDDVNWLYELTRICEPY
ncbi:hypothetical protein THRCLA_21381 [Thraustotheca clavata]|uniref:Uncharacterized protein n=1 Tax=Thraustotheca clavata TaxID=74557 RepID=A0A1V9ZXA4_9STRA|nr:hypothetical protein THRCLA_21381 [Thraustotheca clavata]